MTTPDEILNFWFGDLEGPTDFKPEKAKLWWAGGEAIDHEIQERFGQAVLAARAGELDAWLAEPKSALALILLLDQFSRNLGRGTPLAFATDAAALRACETAIERGHDQKLRPIECSFLYMPLMHAEDRTIAARSVEQFERLSERIRASCPSEHPDALSYAKQHAEIVQRFGRYPHRNAILGRESTDQELAFLEGGGPNFGQTKA